MRLRKHNDNFVGSCLLLVATDEAVAGEALPAIDLRRSGLCRCRADEKSGILFECLSKLITASCCLCRPLALESSSRNASLDS